MITKKLKILSWALIASCALNVAFIGAWAYTRLENTALVSTIMGKQEIVPTNVKICNAMSRLTFRELVSYLTNRELIEEGYTKRDLAVAVLASYHHFNLEKALSGKPAQMRTLLLSNDQTIEIFPGLTEEQFEAIIRFAYQEKWPLTGKGLFALLQAQKAPRDESLEQAFLLTPEFYALQILFQKTGAPQEPHTLIDLAAEGSWNLLEKLFQEQSKVLEFSEEKRRALLVNYCALHSPTAAQILLKTDAPFALKRFDDKQILDLLALMKKQTEEGTRFCIDLLRSPRSDAIWQAAALTLYSYAGEMPPLPIDPQTVLARFAPDSKHTPQPELVVSPPSARYHIVKEGESLWKISRQYKVKVDEIVRMNGLEKDSLYPGMTLKLPN